MRYLSLSLTIILLTLTWACGIQEEPVISKSNDFTQESLLSFVTENGTEVVDIEKPSVLLMKSLTQDSKIVANPTRNAEECTAPCDLTRRFQLRTNSRNCGTEDCFYFIEIGVCFQEVSNGTTEIFFGNVDFELGTGCTGIDEDCVKAEAISRITNAIVNSIYQLLPGLPDPLACGGPTVNWFSTYSETSCKSNCEISCGTACCQYYTSWCLDGEGDLLLGQFEGSNQISDSSGNSNLPEGCDCFQTDCENQYDF